MILSQLRTQIDRRTGKQQDIPAANSYVNEAVNTISSFREWPWLDALQSFDITADVNDNAVAGYDLPDNYSETRTVNVQGEEAQLIYVADADSFNLDFDNWTNTYCYTIDTNQITFFPTPPVGTPVLHRYTRVEATLSSDNQAPLMPERYHSLIADLAAGLFLERVNPARSDMYLARYEKGQKRMAEGVQRKTNPNSVRIRPGFAY